MDLITGFHHPHSLQETFGNICGSSHYQWRRLGTAMLAASGWGPGRLLNILQQVAELAENNSQHSITDEKQVVRCRMFKDLPAVHCLVSENW